MTPTCLLTACRAPSARSESRLSILGVVLAILFAFVFVSSRANAQDGGGEDKAMVVITQEHFLTYLTALNSDLVRPSLASCHARETRRMQQFTANSKQQLLRAETITEQTELKESIAQMDGAEPVYARATCLAHGTVLMLHMFGIGDPSVKTIDDVNKIRTVLANRTAAGWTAYAKVLGMESTTDAYKTVVARGAESFAAQVGANLGQSYGGSDAAAANGNADPLQKKLAALEDQMTLSGAARLASMTSDLINPLILIIATALDVERAARLDPNVKNNIELPEELKTRFIANAKNIARLTGCTIKNNDMTAQVALRDAVCTP